MKNNWILTALRYADSVLPDDQVFQGGNPKAVHPIAFVMFLIEAQDRRILVDPGCDDLPGFEMDYCAKPVEMLKRAGLTPADITDVVITHAHYDHIEAVKYFPDSKIHIQREEYEVGKYYIPEGFQVELFEDSVELTPDIRVQKIGGHSVGSSIVLLEDAQTWVLCGDECYLRQCLTDRVPTGNSHNPQISREFVCRYSSAEYHTVLCHDPELKTGILKG